MTARNAARLAIVTLDLLWLGVASPAWSQSASNWDTQTHAAARLLAGGRAETAGSSFVRAGLEIRLDPGWKTYWRYPGDSGVPPTFDFGGSANVRTVEVRWPAPEQFPDGAGGHSIGYAGDVILPLRVSPRDLTRPALLHLKLNYAVCGNLCVPAQATLALTLTGDGGQDAALRQAVLLVPKRLSLGVPDANGLAIESVRREAGSPHDRVVVDLAAPAAADVTLFVEGPTPEWALPLPESVGPASGPTRRFAFDLDGLPPDAQAKDATLTFTAVSAGQAIEVAAHLD